MKHLMLSFLLSSLVHADGLETGAVKRSDGAAFYLNTIPQIARLSNGQLLTVWWVSGKGQPKGSIYGAWSSESGRTWSDQKLLIEVEVKASGVPTIVLGTARRGGVSARSCLSRA